MAQLKLFRGEYYLWYYVPSRIAAIVFAVIFSFLTMALLWRMCRTRMWFFTAFVVGGLFELIGFAARSQAYDNTDQLMPYVIQNTFILLAPVLFAATIYMVLGRLIHLVKGEPYSLVPIRWLTKVFVTGDALSFVVQGGAAGLSVINELAAMGQKMVIAGLLIQIIIFGFFIVTTVVFHTRMNRCPTVESRDPSTTWRQHLNSLYVVSILILVRSVFRAVEYIQGSNGYLLKNEWPMYIFDSMLMVLVMVVFIIKYPENLNVPVTKGALLPLRSLSR